MANWIGGSKWVAGSWDTTTIEPPLLKDTKVDELEKKVDDLVKYNNYIADKINSMVEKKDVDEIVKKKDKTEIFMIFYINNDDLTRQQSEESMYNLMKNYSKNKFKSYDIEYIWIPVKNQETKVEIINPGLVNGDIVKTFKNLVESMDGDKYKDIINNLSGD